MSQMKNPIRGDHQTAAMLFRFAGAVALVMAMLFSRSLLEILDRNPPLARLTIEGIGGARLSLLLLGVSLLFVGEILSPKCLPSVRRLFDRPVATKLLLSVLSIVLPLIMAEIMLRPFVLEQLHYARSRKTTTLFVRDPARGWRMRPGVQTHWGGVEIRINARGLRGPQVPYPRTSGTPRLLYLGDSVTFGYMLPRDEDAYPFVAGRLLKEALGRDVETVNGAVGGYSPWQEFLFLQEEGIKYQPDLIVVGFVLNDVVEKFGLVRFGGNGIGQQLGHSYFSAGDWLKHNSAICLTLQRLKTRREFGRDVKKGAIAKELTSVKDLATKPDAPDVKRAWTVALEELDRGFAMCRSADIPVMLVAFPYTFQFSNPSTLSAPQSVLASFCATNHVPYLDLLPRLSEHMAKHGETYHDLFLDEDHLSAKGSSVVAEMIVEFLRSDENAWNRLAVPSSERLSL